MHNLHFKNSPKVLCVGGLQDVKIALSCNRIKRRKCVRMIQPISTLTPRVGFRGSNSSYMQSKGFSDAGAALINAGGLSVAAGGTTAAVARIYTKSWAQAGMLGLFGMFLTMFFMAPQLIEKFGLKKSMAAVAEGGALKQDAIKIAETVKTLKPAKRLVPFRQQS